MEEVLIITRQVRRPDVEVPLEDVKAFMENVERHMRQQMTDLIMGHHHVEPCEVCDGTKTYHHSTMMGGVYSPCWKCIV